MDALNDRNDDDDDELISFSSCRSFFFLVFFRSRAPLWVGAGLQGQRRSFSGRYDNYGGNYGGGGGGNFAGRGGRGAPRDAGVRPRRVPRMSRDSQFSEESIFQRPSQPPFQRQTGRGGGRPRSRPAEESLTAEDWNHAGFPQPLDMEDMEDDHVYRAFPIRDPNNPFARTRPPSRLRFQDQAPPISQRKVKRRHLRRSGSHGRPFRVPSKMATNIPQRPFVSRNHCFPFSSFSVLCSLFAWGWRIDGTDLP